jgi:hypothetical protein
MSLVARQVVDGMSILRQIEDLEGQTYEIAKRQRKLGYRMDHLLEDMKYTFQPRSLRSSFQTIDDEEDARCQE